MCYSRFASRSLARLNSAYKTFPPFSSSQVLLILQGSDTASSAKLPDPKAETGAAM